MQKCFFQVVLLLTIPECQTASHCIHQSQRVAEVTLGAKNLIHKFKKLIFCMFFICLDQNAKSYVVQ